MLDIRPGRDSDKDQILALFEDVFGTDQAERAARRWEWQWQGDPRLEKPGYRGVVADWNGLIIGSISCIPAGLHIEGQPVEAYWFVDTMVHWGRLRQAMRERKRGGATGWPDLSHGIAAAMLDHPVAGAIQLGKHLTSPMALIPYKIGCEDQKGTGSWARLISFRQPAKSIIGKPLGLLLGGTADLFIPRCPKPKLEVATLEGDFDARFDDLWAKAKLDYQAIARRDRVTLNWRYRRHPDTAYTVLTLEEKGALSGYLVYSVFFRHRQRRAHIVDVLARRENTAAFDALLADALQRLRREEVHKVECYAGGSTLSAALKRAGFAPRLTNGKEQATLIRRMPDVELYITRGDGDCG